jgi:hypothetical protein
MIPQYAPNRNQRYVNAEIDIPIPTNEAIIEYCKIPRRKKEIREHFGLKIFQVKSHIDPLIKDGRLKGTEPENPENWWQRYVSAEYKLLTLDEIIMDFCKEPRTRQEIAEQAGINIDHLKQYLNPLLDGGKLKMTIPAIPTSTCQRFVIADNDTATMSEESLIEFCATPRSKIEIMVHFSYNTNQGMKTLLGKLIKEKKLVYLNPEMPMCRWQKYVKAQ